MRSSRNAKHEKGISKKLANKKGWRISILLIIICLVGAGFWFVLGDDAKETNATDLNPDLVYYNHAERINNKGLKQLAFELGNRIENESIVPPITEEDYIDVPEEMLINNHENEEGQKYAYLTFDDGPMPFTMDILNLLDKYNAKATFFMLEPYIKNYPEIVHEMVNRGHQIALHSVTHDVKKIYASSQSVVNEMEQTLFTMEEVTGIRSYIMRVPYGSIPHMKPDYIAAVNDYGFLMWDWNIDSQDWKLTDGSYINHTINQIQAFASDDPMVILLHDRQTTVDHLEKLLIYLSDNGYEMKRLEPEFKPVQFVQS